MLAGGIVGRLLSSSSINNCYNMGSVSTTASGSTYAGGIVGEMSNSYVSNVYNTGLINATTASGIVGVPEGGKSMINCYYSTDSATRGYGPTGGASLIITNVKSLTSTQMCQQSSFDGFDFTTVWAISPSINNGYPYLRGLQP